MLGARLRIPCRWSVTTFAQSSPQPSRLGFEREPRPLLLSWAAFFVSPVGDLSVMAIYGDTSGSLANQQHGKHQVLQLDQNGGSAFGDAEELRDTARGGRDTLIGGADAAVNNLFGDADSMADRTVAGNDTLYGGAQASFNNLFGDAFFMAGDSRGGDDRLTGGAGATSNTLYGDAWNMNGSARGGDDVLKGGADSGTNNLFGDADAMSEDTVGGNDRLVGGANSTNILHGDARTMTGNAVGGDDVLKGGGAGTTNTMYGDAETLSGNAVGGNDTLIAGAGTALMWGDGQLSDNAKGGADTFVFGPKAADDTIFDFRSSDGDKIDVSALGMRSLADMTITSDASGDARIAFEPNQQQFLSLVSQTGAFGNAGSVTLVGVPPDQLHASDFKFA